MRHSVGIGVVHEPAVDQATLRPRAVVQRDRVRAALATGPRTPYEVVPATLGVDELPHPRLLGWALTETLCYLRHLERLGEAAEVDGADPALWEAAA